MGYFRETSEGEALEDCKPFARLVILLATLLLPLPKARAFAAFAWLFKRVLSATWRFFSCLSTTVAVFEAITTLLLLLLEAAAPAANLLRLLLTKAIFDYFLGRLLLFF